MLSFRVNRTLQPRSFRKSFHLCFFRRSPSHLSRRSDVSTSRRSNDPSGHTKNPGTLPRLISFICHSYENCRGGEGFFPFWNSSRASDRVGCFLWSAGALLPLFGSARSMDRACGSRAIGLSALCGSTSVNFALSVASVLIPFLPFNFQLSTVNFRSVNSAFSVASVLIPFLPFNFQLSTVNCQTFCVYLTYIQERRVAHGHSQGI